MSAIQALLRTSLISRTRVAGTSAARQPLTPQLLHQVTLRWHHFQFTSICWFCFIMYQCCNGNNFDMSNMYMIKLTALVYQYYGFIQHHFYTSFTIDDAMHQENINISKVLMYARHSFFKSSLEQTCLSYCAWRSIKVGWSQPRIFWPKQDGESRNEKWS